MGTVDRRPYLSATSLSQALLDQMADNLDFGLELVVEITAPDGSTIYASDRNKYVGGTFYEALATFPLIRRTIGEWLSPTIEFSRLEIPLGNVDGRFNRFLPGGADFDGWIGKALTVKLGIRDEAATFVKIYDGRVTEVGGFQRDRGKITIITRDEMDRLNKNFPTTALTKTAWPDLEDALVGTTMPVIYGDWTVAPLQEVPNTTSGMPPVLAASIPAFPVNGANAGVIAGTTNLRLFVSEHVNLDFKADHVWLKRGNDFVKFPVGDITAVTGNNDFQIKQAGTGGTALVDGAPFIYAPGDQFYVRVKGRDLGAYSDNLVSQARDILLTYAGALSGDFDTSWTTFRDRAQTNAILSRVWVQEPENAVTYALSMLEQYRLEMFVDRNLKLKLTSLHLSDFSAAPGFTVRQWDLREGSLGPKLDDRNIWNRARAEYAYDPVLKANSRQTPIYRNQAAIDQVGKEISKKAVFPNLYEEATVADQLTEMLRLATGYPEMIDLVLSPRAVLKDVGDFVLLNIEMGSTVFENVPAQIREIGYDPKGLAIPVKVWSMQMTPFPGWAPGYPGIVGGNAAVITEE